MTEMIRESVLAVDGGGTRCRMALCSGGSGRWVVELGAANVTSDFSGAALRIREGLSALAEQAGCAPETLYDVPAYLGLAGVTGPEMAARFGAALPLQRVQIADDRQIALQGALDVRHGALAHCGTGSFFAAQGSEGVRFSGGWGLILGDEASAAWLGRLALNRTLAMVDALVPGSDLLSGLLADFHDSAGIVAFAATANPMEFGQLARRVTAAATAGDTAAQALMRQGAQHVATTVQALGWQLDQPLCLTGGLCALYTPYLPEAMSQAVVAPLASPLEGAIALARHYGATEAQPLEGQEHSA